MICGVGGNIKRTTREENLNLFMFKSMKMLKREKKVMFCLYYLIILILTIVQPDTR